MNLFDIDYNRYKKYAILGFSKVFGKEYESIIQDRINRSLIIPYMTPNGIYAYVSFLKECKTRELYIEFLSEIGVDVSKFIPNTYAVDLDEKVLNTIDKILVLNSYFDESNNRYSPIHSFDKKNEFLSDILLERRLSIINFILGDNEKVTKETLDEFIKSDKFNEVKDKIKEYDKIYKKLLRRYKRFCDKLDIYEKFYYEETKKFNDILKRKTDEFIEELLKILPQNIMGALTDKTYEEQKDILIYSKNILCKTSLECFSQYDLYELKSDDTSWSKKYDIISSQLKYFSKIGIDVPNIRDYINESEENIDLYFEYINQEDIKKYLLRDEMIDFVFSLREKKYEESIKEYILNYDDYKRVLSILGDDERYVNLVFDVFKNVMICVDCNGRRDYYNRLYSLMFFTIRATNCGILLYTFMHECGHIIDQSSAGGGFETWYYLNYNNEKNPYDNKRRKYELFNETLNDIFTIEALEELHRLNMFPLEKKDYLIQDISNENTSSLSKNILYPLVSKYRDQIIKAKVNANPEELTEYIGVDNFENLVNIVNRVEYLVSSGLLEFLNKEENDLSSSLYVKEYYSLLKLVDMIYKNITSYNYSHIAHFNYRLTK